MPTAGQVVTLSVSGLPSWLSFTPTDGNPASGIIAPVAGVGTFFGILFGVFLIFPASLTTTATDNGASQASATCAKTVRLAIL